jgi:hypothetical protein
MTQVYTAIAATQFLQNSLAPLLARDDAAASNFAGTTFPTSGLLQGMFSYRTDTTSLYLLTDAAMTVWSQVLTKAQSDAAYLSTSGGAVSSGNTLSIAGNLSFSQDTLTTGGFFGRYSPGYGGAQHRYADTSGGTNDPTFASWQFGSSGVERMRLSNAGALTLTTSLGAGTVWHSQNDGVGSGLDADVVNGHNLAYLMSYANHTGTPVLSDAATTTVAVIRAGVPIGNYLPLTGGTLTGRMTLYSNGAGKGMNNYYDGTCLTWIQSDSYGNSLSSPSYMQFMTNTGQLYTTKYGFLENAFAARTPVAGTGVSRIFTTSTTGPYAISQGYEIYDTGDGQQQVREWVNNCQNCTPTVNCDCSGGGGT